MVVCTVTYNASTGDNSGASGSNAPTTPITGANADIATTTITLNETVDFTGVNDDGTDVIKIDTPNGDPHLYRITAFNPSVAAATTLTVARSAPTARTADSWAVGGIRLDFDEDGTRPDFSDMEAGWEFSLEDTADFAISTLVTPISLPGVGDLTDGPISIVAAPGNTPTITWTESQALFETSADTKVLFRGLTMNNTVSTSAAARCIYVVSGGGVKITCIDLIIDAPQCIHVATGVTQLHVENCDLEASQGVGILLSNGRCNFMILGGRVHDCVGSGITISPTSLCAGSIISVDIYGNTVHGIDIDASETHVGVSMHNLVLHNNGQDGISFTGTIVINAGPYSIINNIITDSGGHGIDGGTGDADGGTLLIRENHNAFRGNTAGELRGLDQGADDVTLTADPYTNAAGADFSTNATAGGGAACRDVGFGR